MSRQYDAETRFDILYAVRERAELLGDLYRPRGLAKAPVLVAVHGGGFQIGDRKFYQFWARIWRSTATPCSRSSTG